MSEEEVKKGLEEDTTLSFDDILKRCTKKHKLREQLLSNSK